MTTDPPKARTAIVIATHKQCYPLDRCLASHRALLANSADLVFVDNGSQDGMGTWARGTFPDITVIRRDPNGFFCGGYNAGLQHALDNNYEFALIVNADTEVHDPRFLNGLLDAAARHPRGAFFGPRVFLREVGNVQNTVLEFPNFRRNFVGRWRSVLGLNRPLRSGDCEKRVEYLNGVCVLCRISALREIGLMDEVMGGYVEDVDWSWRARALGWYSVYVPVPSIIHHQEDVGYEHYSLKMFLLRRNQVYWHIKCGRPLQARLYALGVVQLARLRRWHYRRNLEVVQHYDYYIRRFAEVARRLLAGDVPGKWFGPPIGDWEEDEAARKCKVKSEK